MTRAWASSILVSHVVLIVVWLGRPAAAVEAPVTAVTVFSDRARVTRTATVNLAGKQRVELPLLGERVDAGSVRLDGRGAEVETVDLAWVVGDAAFPRDDAQALLKDLAALDRTLAEARRDRDLHARSDLLPLIEPVIPSVDAVRAAPRVNGSGWRSVARFAETWSQKQQARVRALDEKVRELRQKRADLAAQAHHMGAHRRRGGWKVTATVAGNGPATLELAYLITGARWHPSYDILLDAGAQKVDVAFAGLVSQETGEDWTKALFTLSTAIPATTTAFPRLYTWKVGERERFIPKPRPYVEPIPPAPPAPPVPPRMTHEVDDLRRRLLGVVHDQGAEGADVVAALKERVRQQQRVRPADGAVESGFEGDVAGGVVAGMAADEAAAPQRGVAPAMPPPPAAPAPSEAFAQTANRPAPVAARNESYDQEAMEEMVDMPASVGARKAKRMSAASAPAPAVGISLAPPDGYRPPPLPIDLPASLAGGYDLVYKAAAPETVLTGKGARRVALFARSFPVTVERRVFPDLQPEAAFLVAELKNPTGQPLPGGNARLFVGADPAGEARLRTVAPGETFTLPLGLDRGIKPIRNVKVVTSESGLLSKQETSTYTVSIEVSNPTRNPMRLRVVDQIPVTDDKDVEIKLLSTSPAVSARDAVSGKLEWSLTAPATAKVTVGFVYTLKRPKGYRLRAQ